MTQFKDFAVAFQTGKLLENQVIFPEKCFLVQLSPFASNSNWVPKKMKIFIVSIDYPGFFVQFSRYHRSPLISLLFP